MNTYSETARIRLARLAQTQRFLEAVKGLQITIESCEYFAQHHVGLNEHHAEFWYAEAESATNAVCDLFEFSMNELDTLAVAS